MPPTTIKVTPVLRDRISNNARAQQKTLGAFLTDLVDDWERRQRMAALGQAIRSNPPDAEYWQEFAAYASMSGGAADA